LEELDIPRERIVNYETYEERISCWYIENHAVICGTELALCCGVGISNRSPVVYFDESDTPEQKVDKYLNFRAKLRESIKNGEPCACSECLLLERRFYRDNKKLSRVLPYFNHICNLKCLNCYQRKHIEEKEKYSVIDFEKQIEIIETMRKENIVDNKTEFSYSRGEISIHPERRMLLQIAGNSRCLFHSNCVVYDDVFYEHLQSGESTIICSLDAGTRETYKKIKGADCLDEVCKNLKKYSEFAKINLKYIFFEGINDNEEDVDGFIRIASELLPDAIIITRDCTDTKNFSEKCFYLSSKIVRKTDNLGLKCHLPIIYFTNDEQEKIKNLAKNFKEI